jgi:hypothetical protein
MFQAKKRLDAVRLNRVIGPQVEVALLAKLVARVQGAGEELS